MQKRMLCTIMLCMFVALPAFHASARAMQEGTIDASGRWMYVLGEDGVTLVACKMDGYAGALIIPGELDGHAVTGIGDEMFWSCTGLADITIQDSVTSIGKYAFMYSDVKAITIPGSVKCIGDWAFNESALRSVVFESGVTSIGECAFSHCYGLTSVSIPASVITIGEYAFVDCDDIILTVTAGSAAECFARENGIAYMLENGAD